MAQPDVVDELCRCGHLKSLHADLIHYQPASPGHESTFIPESNHGGCKCCNCFQFTWTGMVLALDDDDLGTGILGYLREQHPRLQFLAGLSEDGRLLAFLPESAGWQSGIALTVDRQLGQVDLYTGYHLEIGAKGEHRSWALGDPEWPVECSLVFANLNKT